MQLARNLQANCKDLHTGKSLRETRRSNQFAETSFLKRCANDEGFVASDIKTEQIASDASFISLKSGRYTSYTHLTGSAPFFWSQDTTQGRIVPKPQILVDRTDPYYAAAALHFNNLMARFGAPIIILILVKVSPKRFTCLAACTLKPVRPKMMSEKQN
eukprot:gene12377-13650_t